MEKKLNIPNIFHFMYDSSHQDDLYEHEYFSIKSVFEINKPDKIYFHYNNEPKGKLWNKIKKILTLNRTNIELSVNKTKYIFIFKILLKFGGIYLELKSLCINPMKELLKYNFFKSVNNDIIGSEPKSFMAFKYLQYLLGNNSIINFTEKFGIRNINGEFINNFLIEDLNYNTSDNNINNIFFEEINDYSFSQYFHLVKNCNFIFFNNVDNLNNLTLEYIFNKITIYNLLIRQVLSYNLINNNSIKINFTKYKFINNIDCIYWINLSSSNKRRENMKKLLRNINIQNQIINAVDGNIIEDVASKYYYSENNIYPKYSNKEYAVLLSHLKALETYSLYNEPKFKVALICEDDICYDFINYWNCDIKNIVKDAPEDWDIIMLGYFSLNLNFGENYKKWDNEWSALSYLVNYNSMHKLESLKKNDLWVCKDSDLMVSDNYIFSKFNTYVYKYPYFTFPNENDSTFHEDHLNYHRIYKISNYLTLEKIYDDYLKEI